MNIELSEHFTYRKLLRFTFPSIYGNDGADICLWCSGWIFYLEFHWSGAFCGS